MGHLSLRLPDSLHRKLREIAEKDGVSVNQFIATAVAEKAAALLTLNYLTERGKSAQLKLVNRLLKRVPDVEPVPGDELPSSCSRSTRLKSGRRRSATRRRSRS